MCPRNECANQNPKVYKQTSVQKQRAKQNQQSRDKFIPGKMEIIKQPEVDFKIIMFTVLLGIEGEIASIFYKRGRHLKMKVVCQLFLNETGKIVKMGSNEKMNMTKKQILEMKSQIIVLRKERKESS